MDHMDLDLGIYVELLVELRLAEARAVTVVMN